MSHYSDIGNLMYLDLDIIESKISTSISNYLVEATAKKLKNNNSRNWIPLIVKEVAEYRYQVIGNSFIYEVTKAAKLEKVWCIIADDSEETAAIAQMLAGETIPKTNLSTASQNEIKAALEYLVEQFSVLRGIKVSVAADRISQAPRQYWQDLKPITKLKCGITSVKKIAVLEQVFYLTPEPIPDNIKDPQVLKTFNSAKLKKIAKQRNLTGYSKYTKDKLINLLSQ